MRLQIFQVDAFTERLFGGNPAAVVPLAEWPEVELLQAIAAENNLAETAFFVPRASGRYDLRWFTPTVEVNLCGHATLAAAFLLLSEIEPERSAVSFDTRSGELVVTRAAGGRFALDFPVWSLEAAENVPVALSAGLGAEPLEVLVTTTHDNYFVVLETERDVAALQPDMRRLATLHPAGVAVTALASDDGDFVYRYFAPSYGVDEDSGTGSVQCGLIPYWEARLGKPDLVSRQLSHRGAVFHGMRRGDRVVISGHAVKYLEGWIQL